MVDDDAVYEFFDELPSVLSGEQLFKRGRHTFDVAFSKKRMKGYANTMAEQRLAIGGVTRFLFGAGTSIQKRPFTVHQ